MKDGVIKNDGTSRLIKANLPATYEQMRTMAANGTLPADILFNADGWDVLPDFLNKKNLFSDKTANIYGMGKDAVPDDVFARISATIPQLIVITEPNLSIVAVLGDVFVETKSDENGRGVLALPGFGTWKITCADETGDSMSDEIVVDTCTMYSLSVSMRPVLTYSGQYEEIKGETTADWRLRLLSSGTLTAHSNSFVDVFMVGGGQGGGASNGSGAANCGPKGGDTFFGELTVRGGGETASHFNGGSGGSVNWGTPGNGGSDGSDGSGGQGQGTTTREFGESDGTLYAAGGGSGGGGKAGDDSAADGTTATTGLNAPNNRGGGGGGSGSGGGGAGGYTATHENYELVPGTTINVVIGAGGNGATDSNRVGGKGGSGIVVLRRA